IATGKLSARTAQTESACRLWQLGRFTSSFASSGLFNRHPLLKPECGLGAQPLQRFNVVSENFDDLSQAVEPPRFDSPFPLAAPHYAEKRPFLAHAGFFAHYC